MGFTKFVPCGVRPRSHGHGGGSRPKAVARPRPMTARCCSPPRPASSASLAALFRLGAVGMRCLEASRSRDGFVSACHARSESCRGQCKAQVCSRSPLCGPGDEAGLRVGHGFPNSVRARQPCRVCSASCCSCLLSLSHRRSGRTAEPPVLDEMAIAPPTPAPLIVWTVRIRSACGGRHATPMPGARCALGRRAGRGYVIDQGLAFLHVGLIGRQRRRHLMSGKLKALCLLQNLAH